MQRFVVGSLMLLAAALVGSGCDRTRQASAQPAHVDSVVRRAVALERFRAGMPPVESLSGGATSRDALVRQFVRALETRDTVALRRMALTKAEYAWLYYPTNPQGLPPYDLSPGLLWFMIESRGTRGLGHALEERGGRLLGYVGHDCDPTPSVEGANRVYGPCLVRRVEAPGDTVAERLFGLVIERGGRFKFISYANKLD